MLEKLQNTKPYKNIKIVWRKFLLLDSIAKIYKVLKVLINKLIQFDIDVRAAAVAFNFTLAIFPSIIFMFSLIPYIPLEHLDDKIINLLSTVMPAGIFKEAKNTIVEIVSKPQGGILSLGFIFALYASTSGVMALMRAFNTANRTVERRGFIKARLIAVMINFLLTFVLLLAILVLIVGRLSVDFLFDEGILNRDITFYTIQFLSYIVIFFVFFITISIIYYFAPMSHKRWKFVNTGSITASILTILITNLFSYYLSNFASYNRLYGTIGTFIALMVWLYLVAMILILGFEINASIQETNDNEDNKKKQPS